MKKIVLIALGITVFAAVSFTNPPGRLAGRWQQKVRGGAMMLVNFRADSSYNISINGKYILGGNYYVKNDTVGLTDGACNPNYRGMYKLDFFAADSVRFIVIQDTCAGRRKGYDKGTVGRIKSDPVTPSK